MKFPIFPRRGEKSRFERFNIVVAILIAGWVPSILMLVISYTALTAALEHKIRRDRQTFVQLTAHLVGDDLESARSIVEYYQTAPDVARILQSPNAVAQAQQWVNRTFYSHPRLDAMMLTDADGRLLAAIPPLPQATGMDYGTTLWKDGALSLPGAFTSPIHPRHADGRISTKLVGAVRNQNGQVLGFVGVDMLVERIGRRLSTIQFDEASDCEVFDQTGLGLFEEGFRPTSAFSSPSPPNPVVGEILGARSGYFEREGMLYSFHPIADTDWIIAVKQPRSVAYQPVTDLLSRITIPVIWLVVLTALAAWGAGGYYRRQAETARRIEREIIFNEKILANMPSGIALIDPATRRFLQANEAFEEMVRELGGLAIGQDLLNSTYNEVKIAPPDAIDKVLSFGTPFQLIEKPFPDKTGYTRYLNVNLLRLQDSQQVIQGVLYLIEDKTRDVSLRQELISANAAKDQFLALLSHELRNPLSPVLAMVSELEASGPDTSQMHQALEIIRRNVELEARLIDDLLDVTRISKGKLQLSFEIVSTNEILRRAYEICEKEIAEKNFQVDFHLRAAEDHVEGDSARLQQVFWNLIKNAVKFTDEGGRISVRTENPTPEEIEITITDTGIGIDPARAGRIFNAFEQGQSSITRRFGGLGLGLAISKALVAAHGGSIETRSEGLGKGATFAVRLHTVPAPVPSATDGELVARNGAEAPRPPFAGKRVHRVLVVDDHEDTCTGMKMILERRGYEITIAHSADQAVQKAGEKEFDLLISDIGLPDRSGYELMQELKSTRGLRGIALSGFGMEKDVHRAHAAGFSEHLTKPINFERLEEVMRRLLPEEELAHHT